MKSAVADKNLVAPLAKLPVDSGEAARGEVGAHVNNRILPPISKREMTITEGPLEGPFHHPHACLVRDGVLRLDVSSAIIERDKKAPDEAHAENPDSHGST